MKMPEWTSKAVWGVVGGAVATIAIGFMWGGWMTGGDAEAMAKAESQKAVVAALTPICLQQAASDPELEVKMAALGEESSFKQRGILEDSGWATMPGSEQPNRQVAAACLAELVKSLKE